MTGNSSQFTITWQGAPLPPPDAPPAAGVLVPRSPLPSAPPVLAMIVA